MADFRQCLELPGQFLDALLKQEGILSIPVIIPRANAFDGPRRASISAQGASAASVLDGRIRIERGLREHGDKPHPRTVLRRYEEQILPLPTQSGHAGHGLVADGRTPILAVENLRSGYRKTSETIPFERNGSSEGDRVQNPVGGLVRRGIDWRGSIGDGFKNGGGKLNAYRNGSLETIEQIRRDDRQLSQGFGFGNAD